MKYVRIEVTDEDIAQGERLEAARCPIARAVKRAVQPNTYVFVDSYGIELDDYQTYRAPNKAARFVTAFDKGEEVKPFAFTLRLPNDIVL